MKRKRKVSKDSPLWKKNGGGCFRLKDGTIIKPQETFHAKEEEIPEAFRDIIVKVEPVKKKQTKAKAKPKEFLPPYDIIQREGSDLWDVIDANKETITDGGGLSEEEADAMLTKLHETKQE